MQRSRKVLVSVAIIGGLLLIVSVAVLWMVQSIYSGYMQSIQNAEAQQR